MPNGDHRQILQDIARRAMRERGLEPDFPLAARAQLASIGAAPTGGLRDLRTLPWSSIDNDESRDLDQIEVCVADGGATRLLVAIADVDSLVTKDSPLDGHARTNTTSVYTPAEIFPMLPPELSTDRTSLNDGADRPAIVIEIRLDASGAVEGETIFAGLVRNQGRLTYSGVAAWLDGSGPAPAALERMGSLADQLRLQDHMATLLRERREAEGALEFDRAELKPILEGDRVTELKTDAANRAHDIIENFMVTANGVTARFLSSHGIPAIRRVVRSPERWDRIAALAAQHGGALPPQPDALALSQFLKQQRAASPATFPDLSLAVLKLLGRGEYVAAAPGEASTHFALAVSSYTHSTAPNRRYPDLIAQRQIKAALGNAPPVYALDALDDLARHCTQQEDAATKVERQVRKSAAALWLSDHIGETYDAVVTGEGTSGTWVRLSHPLVEGRLERGAAGLDVGDRLRVRLIDTNVERGYIDFARV
jgi:VacB/RNase II family 3'-5' exoribonuclease